jgi:hypothetical protein
MNFIKATKEVFLEYDINITTEVQLPDGEYIRHNTLPPGSDVLEEMWDDIRVSMLTADMVREIVREASPSEI